MIRLSVGGCGRGQRCRRGRCGQGFLSARPGTRDTRSRLARSRSTRIKVDTHKLWFLDDACRSAFWAFDWPKPASMDSWIPGLLTLAVDCNPPPTKSTGSHWVSSLSAVPFGPAWSTASLQVYPYRAPLPPPWRLDAVIGPGPLKPCRRATGRETETAACKPF